MTASTESPNATAPVMIPASALPLPPIEVPVLRDSATALRARKPSTSATIASGITAISTKSPKQQLSGMTATDMIPQTMDAVAFGASVPGIPPGTIGNCGGNAGGGCPGGPGGIIGGGPEGGPGGGGGGVPGGGGIPMRGC